MVCNISRRTNSFFRINWDRPRFLWGLCCFVFIFYVVFGNSCLSLVLFFFLLPSRCPFCFDINVWIYLWYISALFCRKFDINLKRKVWLSVLSLFFSQQTLDIQALTQLMDEVKPPRENLIKKDFRKLWLRKVCEYRPVIERVVADFCKQHSFDGNVGQHQCREAIKNAR